MEAQRPADVIRGMAGAAEFPDSVMEEGDYRGEGGLIYCGKCGMRKQKIILVPEILAGGPGKTVVVPVACRCQEEVWKKRKERQEFEEKMIQIRRMKDASLMDSKYRDATFEAYQITETNQKVKKVAENYAEKFAEMYEQNQGLLFYGPVGAGKSYTAACIANRLLERQTPVIMTSFVKIMQNIAGRDEGEYLEMLNSAKLLILDDLGAERTTEYAIEKVYNIVDSRSRASKPMILTTNLELAEMMDCQDIRYKRIYDRILETCYPVYVEGKSFRWIAAEERFDRMQKILEG